MNVTVNGNSYDIPEKTTVADLLRNIELPVEGTAVAINSLIIPRDDFELRVINQGDKIEIIRAVGGG